MSQEVASTHDLTWVENELLLYSVIEIWGVIKYCIMLNSEKSYQELYQPQL